MRSVQGGQPRMLQHTPDDHVAMSGLSGQGSRRRLRRRQTGALVREFAMARSEKMPASQSPMPVAVVDRLLDSLATDDLFRAQFVQDPRAALARLGYEASADETMCMHTAKLADKETILATRDEMRALLLLGSLALIPNRWDAS